jgi:class 3 adenylate cyclase
MVTAVEAPTERVKGLEAGADDFLSKPISQPELLARVRSLLRVKQLYDKVEDQARQLAEWNRTLEARVAEQVAQLERLGKLKRFLPPQVAEQIVSQGADALESHRREIAVVVLELRGFAAFAETTAPEEVMAVLQEVHRVFGRLALEHEGTLERFTGEGMMVLFNDPVPQADAAERAVRMALAMGARSRELAQRWEKLGFALDLAFGIGRGYATLGAIGFEARSEYAAIGTVTHLALGLCEAAAPGEILTSQRMASSVEELVECEAIGERTLRGFSRPVPVFRVLREKAPAALAADAEAADEGAPRAFRQEGEYWTIVYEGSAFRLKDTKGLRYIAELLRSPERELHAFDLVALANDDGHPALPASRPALRPAELGDAGSVLDATAKSAYRKRLEDLRAELAEAESFNDAGRVARLTTEIEFLTRQLASAIGLGGRDRRVGAAAERARVNVTRAISDAIKRIREHSPALARYLEASIRTGTACAYRPPDPRAPEWRL